MRWTLSAGGASVSPRAEKETTILIVDDDADQREYVALMLKRGGYLVLDFGDANEALAALRDCAVDLVISDLSMPHLDGMKFIGILRRTHPAVPIVVLTAHASIDTYFRSFALGAIDYIHKPVNEDELLRIASLVIQKSARRPFRISARTDGIQGKTSTNRTTAVPGQTEV